MRKGWFVIPGVQDGDRTLEQQIKGLEDLDVRGHNVLELGCAEGLMSKWLVQEKGAAEVTGIESVKDHILEARRQCDGLPVHAILLDINSDPWLGSFGRAQFDTVIALAVLHKLKQPWKTVGAITSLASKQIIVRLPPETAPVIVDPRSNLIPCNIEHDILRKSSPATGFSRTRVTRGSFNEWCGWYAR